MNPLTLPPRLLLRALDDLHVLAQAAAELPAIEARLTERIDALDARAEGILAFGERIDARAEAILALGERIDARAGEIVAVGDRVDGVMAVGDRLDARAAEVAAAGREVAAAIPTLQRAVELSLPLEGAVERLGRFVDRLPGGGRHRGEE